MRYTIGIALLGLALSAGSAPAQRPPLARRSLEGPRLGLTLVSGSRAEATLRKLGMSQVMTQFGWHIEQQVSPMGSGLAFVIEEVVLAGGMEQQKFLPSLTLLVGVRTPSGLEFGLGPNLSAVGTALAVAVGKSFTYGEMSFPINLALVGSPDALRTTILIGYAIPTSN
jgi:hypothetical protein